MPKNNPAAKNKMVTPKVKGSWWNRDMSMLTSVVPLKFLPIDWIDVPGRTQVDVSPQIDIESLPAVSPLYDGWTLETYYFFVPHRLYMPTLRINNVQDVGVLDAEKFPFLQFVNYYHDDTQGSTSSLPSYMYLPFISAGSLLHRLGYTRGDLVTMRSYDNIWGAPSILNVAAPGSGRIVNVNAIPFFAYIDVWLYSQFNKQDKYIPVESMSGQTIDTNGLWSGDRQDKVTFVDYDKLKEVIPGVAYSRSFASGTSANVGTWFPAIGRLQFGQSNFGSSLYRNELVDNYPIFDCPQYYYNRDTFAKAVESTRNVISNTGLLPVTYYGDRFTSWFDKESVTKLQSYVVEDSQSLLSLRYSNSDMFLDMIAMVSGNDYRSYLKFVFGTELDLCDHPILVGKDSIRFGFMDVLNQSANVDTSAENVTDINQSLAYTASKARSKNHNVRDINFKTREPGLFMVFASLRPSVRYFQGRDRFLDKTEFSELWHPQYSSRGFDQLKISEICSQFVGSLNQSSAGIGNMYPAVDLDRKALNGYVPLGWEYQTGLRKLGGAMVLDRYRTWSLARDFTIYDGVDVDSNDSFAEFAALVNSTYGNRANFDFNFVDTSYEAQNFIMNFSAKVRCYQPMSKVLVKPTI